MRLLYGLLLTISLTSSLQAVVSSCTNGLKLYVSSGSKVVTGYSNKSYQDTWYCSANGSILPNSDFFYFDYDDPVNTTKNTITGYRYVTSCPTGDIPNDDGLCEAPPPPPDSDGDGTPDKCDKSSDDWANADCDGDGTPNREETDSDDNGIPDDEDPDFDSDGDNIPNGTDSDDNGNGVQDENDPSHPDYDKPDVSCTGLAKKGTETFYGTQYGLGEYNYLGKMIKSACSSKISLSAYDGSYGAEDSGYACEDEYCFVHKSNPNCNFSAAKYKPSGQWLYSSDTTENECTALIDGEKFVSSSYVKPSLFCPNTGFCYIQYAIPPEYESNQEDDDGSMEAPDLNTTTPENQSLLQSQNTTNKHLQDLKNKTDSINNSLTDIKSNTNDLKTLSEQTKQSLDQLNLDNKNSMSKQLSELKKNNSAIENVSKGIAKTNERLKSLNQTNTNINNQMNSANLRLENIQEELLKDHGLYEDVTDGLSDSLSSIDSDAKLSFDGFVFTDVLGLSSLPSSSIPPFRVQVSGNTITIFEPSMLNGLPINEIRALILFIFALVGFVHTFRST